MGARSSRPAATGLEAISPGERRPRAGRFAGPKLVPHPDQEAALRRAEEALESALGHGIKVSAAKRGIRAELRFDDVDELLAFARTFADR
jgi:hypothetical protein